MLVRIQSQLHTTVILEHLRRAKTMIFFLHLRKHCQNVINIRWRHIFQLVYSPFAKLELSKELLCILIIQKMRRKSV